MPDRRNDGWGESGMAPGDLDLDVLLERLDGDGSLLKEVIAVFLEDIRERLVRIRAATGAQQWEAVRIEAHTIKGSAATMAAENLKNAAKTLEIAAGSRQVDDADVDHVTACFERLAIRLRQVLSS